MAANAPAFSAPADWQKIGVDPEQGTGGYYKPIYSADPNSVGYWTGQERGTNENGEGGGVTPVWHGTNQDFTGLTGGSAPDPGFYGHNTTTTFVDKNGLKYNYDYATDSFNGLDPQTAASYLKDNPNAYYGALADQLKNDYFDTWRMGHADESIKNQLDSIKDVSPQAYYNAKIGLLGSEAGWYQGQNTTSGIPEIQKQIQDLAPEAVKAGISPEQLSSTVNQSFSNSANWNQQLIANQAQSGGAFIKPNDWATIGAILAGGFGAAALSPAAAAGEVAAEGAGTIGGEAAGGFGLNPASTSGIGFNAASPSGLMATQSAAGLGGSGTGIIEGLLPSSIGMGGTAGAGSLAGIAGTEALAGLGGSALGTGLTAEQLAAYESANPNTSISDVLKTANQVRQGLSTANSLSKLLSPSSGSAGSTGTTSTSGFSNASLSQLASLLAPKAQTNDFIGQYKMNQNPYTFTAAGQTTAAPGTYDVSGSNMANALRKA